MGAGTGGSRSPTSKDRPKQRPAATETRTTAGNKAYTDKASGKTYDSPKYGGASVRGLTSKDPANVARNRAGAAKYASKSERIASAATRDGNADKAAARAASTAVRPSRSLFADAAKKAVPPAAPTTMATRPPAGYRPGIDPEYNYGTGTAATAPRPAMAPRPTVTATAAPRVRVQPTITLAKGGKAPRKKK